jgi:hypothetical protein
MHPPVLAFDGLERCVVVEQSLTFTVEPLAETAASKGLLMNIVLIVWEVTHQRRDERLVPPIMVVERLVYVGD